MKAPAKGGHLADLEQIRAALREQRRRAESIAAGERERAATDRREKDLFANALRIKLLVLW